MGKKKLLAVSILRSFVRGHATLLLQCGDVKKNPGPAASAEKMVKKDF